MTVPGVDGGAGVSAAAALTAYAWAYGTRARTLARRGRPVARWRAACFAAGLAVAAGAQFMPDGTLTGHMAQHLLIGDLGALLVALGLTGPLLVPVLRIGVLRPLRVLGHPVVALVLWLTNMLAWHVPAIYDAALRVPALHAVEHASFFWLGLVLWFALLGPLPKPRWFKLGAQLAYVVAVRLAGTVLGNVFVWAGAPLYEHYPSASDQITAGALMMVEQMLLTVLVVAWLLLRTLSREEACLVSDVRR